jgi:hypothetical protein
MLDINFFPVFLGLTGYECWVLSHWVGWGRPLLPCLCRNLEQHWSSHKFDSLTAIWFYFCWVYVLLVARSSGCWAWVQGATCKSTVKSAGSELSEKVRFLTSFFLFLVLNWCILNTLCNTIYGKFHWSN